jgi:hypothetical protein
MRMALIRATSFSGIAVLVACLTPAWEAHAFEREWHLGGGLGAAAANGYRLGPALNAYAAYGLTDAFDVRLELAGSRSATVPDPAYLYSAKLAFVYKIDVIQWIPYFGLAGGYLRVTERVAPFALGQPTAGLIGGLDYAVSRSFGLGIAGTYDYAFHPAAGYANAFLRAEYHFGF